MGNIQSKAVPGKVAALRNSTYS